MEELFLKKVDIYGRLIPSDETLWDVLYDLKTAENRLHFSAYSNEAIGAIQHRYNFHKDVFYDLRKYPSWQLIELYELNAELECIWAKQATIVGLDIELLLQSKAVDTWFVTVLGNFTNYNMTAIIRSQSAAKALTLSHLQKYPEYRKARDSIEMFVRFVDENILINPEIKNLEGDAQKLYSRMAKTLDKDILEANKNDGFRSRDNFAYVCPFCGVYKLTKKSIKPKSCGSPQCEKDYWKAQKSRRYKRTDWVFDPDVRPRSCLGTCGSHRRELNSERYCRSCWTERLSQ
jgi:hypothetical protein